MKIKLSPIASAFGLTAAEAAGWPAAGFVDTRSGEHGAAEFGCEGVSEWVSAFYKDYAVPASSFARCALFAISLPAEGDINQALFRPAAQEL